MISSYGYGGRIHLTTRTSTDGKRAPLTAISLQAVGSPKDAPPTYIAMWDVVTKKKFGKNVIFSQNHTEINSDDWTITKKTTRTIKHENFSKMKILKVDRWALSSRWRPVAYLARPLPLPNVVPWSLATRVKKCASLNKNLSFYSNCTPIRGNK